MEFIIENTIEEMGVRIHGLRKEYNVSQFELATEIGITSRALSNIELGRSEMKLNTLMKITAFFDVTLDFLIYGRKPEEWVEGYDRLPDIDKFKILQITQSMVKIFAENEG